MPRRTRRRLGACGRPATVRPHAGPHLRVGRPIPWPGGRDGRPWRSRFPGPSAGHARPGARGPFDRAGRSRPPSAPRDAAPCRARGRWQPVHPCHEVSSRASSKASTAASRRPSRRASTAELRTDDRTLLGRRRLGHGTLQQGCRRRRSAVGHGRCGRVPQPINHPRVPVALGEQQMSGHSFVVTVLVEHPRGAKVRKPAIRLGDVRVHGCADQGVDEVQSSVRVQNPFAAKSRDGARDRLGFHAGKLGDAAKLGVDAEDGDRAADACRFWSEPVHPHEQRSGEGLRSDVAEPTGLVSRRLDPLVLERRQCFHEEERVSAGRPRACFGELGRGAALRRCR